MKVLRAACVASLVSLALIAWALLDRSPWAMIAAMTIGQALGTAALVASGIVILRDMRSTTKASRDESEG